MTPTPFDQLLASAVLEMSREPTVPATLDRVVASAVDTVESCDAAAVLLTEDRAQATVVASDELLRDLVAERAQLESAPAWIERIHQEPLYSADVALDFRWPDLAEHLSRRLGLHSLYAVPLGQPDRPLGVLVAYGKSIDAFDDEDRQTVRILSMHATAVLSQAVQHEQLETALGSRTVIGQATGIVMERFGLDAGEAFGVLRRLSQEENVKLRVIAAQVVDTGHLG